MIVIILYVLKYYSVVTLEVKKSEINNHKKDCKFKNLNLKCKYNPIGCDFYGNKGDIITHEPICIFKPFSKIFEQQNIQIRLLTDIVEKQKSEIKILQDTVVESQVKINKLSSNLISFEKNQKKAFQKVKDCERNINDIKNGQIEIFKDMDFEKNNKNNNKNNVDVINDPVGVMSYGLPLNDVILFNYSNSPTLTTEADSVWKIYPVSYFPEGPFSINFIIEQLTPSSKNQWNLQVGLSFNFILDASIDSNGFFDGISYIAGVGNLYQKKNDKPSNSPYGQSYKSGDIITMNVDENGIEFCKNGISQGTVPNIIKSWNINPVIVSLCHCRVSVSLN
eukprot:TRINITY_DN2267_c0_g1_i1.p1 TRINITY_DN2267_c0_g1~~TRINITY_DN2267_c0_g1_i1.p1  ORF type:complete len:336 (+),score=52.60 TRINITY_DN2267_c0_g1_i1:91-1098(+)